LCRTMLPITPDSFQHGTKMAILLSGSSACIAGISPVGLARRQFRQYSRSKITSGIRSSSPLISSATASTQKASIQRVCKVSSQRKCWRACIFSQNLQDFSRVSPTSHFERNTFRLDIFHAVDSGTRGRCCPSQPLYPAGTGSSARFADVEAA
jgi:hypothetical protein